MSTFYEEVGGTEFFEELVSGFYAVVAVDPILSPMYPDKDWHAAAERLQWFLEQYWGGPSTYQRKARTSTLTNASRRVCGNPCCTRCLAQCDASGC